MCDGVGRGVDVSEQLRGQGSGGEWAGKWRHVFPVAGHTADDTPLSPRLSFCSFKEDSTFTGGSYMR